MPLVGAEGRQGKPPLYVRATYEREPSDAVTQRACCRTTAWSGSGFGFGLGFGLGLGLGLGLGFGLGLVLGSRLG